MSPRAAWRLESWGFERVYDYVAGKNDWLAFDLPSEGTARFAGSVVNPDVATCGYRDSLDSIREDLRSRGIVIALNEAGVVLGVVHAEALESDAATVDRAMHEGPTTVRPSEEIEGLVERMGRADVDAVLVTRSDGTLLGMFERHRAEHALEAR